MPVRGNTSTLKFKILVRIQVEAQRKSMSKVIPNMEGRARPELNCDRLGYPPSVGDYEWEVNLKNLYVQVPGGWVRRDEAL